MPQCERIHAQVRSSPRAASRSSIALPIGELQHAAGQIVVGACRHWVPAPGRSRGRCGGRRRDRARRGTGRAGRENSRIATFPSRPGHANHLVDAARPCRERCASRTRRSPHRRYHSGTGSSGCRPRPGRRGSQPGTCAPWPGRSPASRGKSRSRPPGLTAAARS